MNGNIIIEGKHFVCYICNTLFWYNKRFSTRITMTSDRSEYEQSHAHKAFFNIVYQNKFFPFQSLIIQLLFSCKLCGQL